MKSDLEDTAPPLTLGPPMYGQAGSILRSARHSFQSGWMKVIVLTVLVAVFAGATRADIVVEVPPYRNAALDYNSGTVREDPGMFSGWQDHPSESEHRAFYLFWLPSSTQTIISAEWQFFPAQASYGFFGFSFYDLYDVTTGSGTLPATVAGFNDLGSGKHYGQQVMTEDNVGGVVRMPLSADAVSDMNAARGGSGYFGMGSTYSGGEAVMWILDTTESEEEPYANKLILVTEDPPPTPGDTDEDHDVDDIDYANLIAQFGGPPGADSADFNGDGKVNLEDFSIMRENFGLGVISAPDVEPGAATPEPATMTLLALGGLAVIRRPRKTHR
jgi:MYXO-CTERM domain-containing protein